MSITAGPAVGPCMAFQSSSETFLRSQSIRASATFGADASIAVAVRLLVAFRHCPAASSHVKSMAVLEAIPRSCGTGPGGCNLITSYLSLKCTLCAPEWTSRIVAGSGTTASR